MRVVFFFSMMQCTDLVGVVCMESRCLSKPRGEKNEVNTSHRHVTRSQIGRFAFSEPLAIFGSVPLSPGAAGVFL